MHPQWKWPVKLETKSRINKMYSAEVQIESELLGAHYGK